MKKFRAMTAALVAVIILGVAGNVFLGNQLYDSRQENALLADQMDSQTASLEAEIDSLNGELSALESSGGEKDSKISELESEVETLEAQVKTLEAQLAEKSKPASSSGSSGSSSSSGSTSSSGSSGSTSSASDTQSVTVYVTRTGEKYHRSGCRYLSNSKIPISLSNARASGYTACSVCF